MDRRFLVLILATILQDVRCQTNTGNNVADGLLDCYNNSALPGITIANERPAAHMNLLIEFIRKLEDANPTMNARTISYHVLQRLRQDGISRTERTVDERLGVPFSSRRLERYKFKVLLENLLPNAEQTFGYGDLSNFEKCSLHYMISNTIDDLKRENEATECTRSARYTLRNLNRGKRGVGEDMENTEFISQDPALGAFAETLTRNVSQCPIELGVVYSEYGTIKAGNVLAGIAAGLNPQTIQNGLVDSRYAATLVGELCEASLYQASTDVSLGASGGWNSTINPKYFFLQNNNRLQATDAELRGALDGLLIALQMTTLTSRFSALKISQMLDMFYSSYEKGIFDTGFKACNRSSLYGQLTTSDTMTTQLYNFMPVLNQAAISGVSLSNASFALFASSGVTAFETYLPRMASTDLACTGTSTIQRVVADLLIFIDTNWPYTTVQPVISYILNNIDVNRYQTRYTIYGGSSLRNLTTNVTTYLSNFYLQYNQSVHSNEMGGFDYQKVFETIEAYGYSKLNNNSYRAGESTLVLLLPRTTMTEDQRNFVSQKRQLFDLQLPDFNFYVFGSGNVDDYSIIVRNANKDVVILQETNSELTLQPLGQQMVENFKEVPRAVVNPTCTSEFNGGTSTSTLTDYVELLGVSYYRISPNYFYNGDGTRNLKIREEGYGVINVCLSRDNSKPDNQTTTTCRSITSSEYSVEITSYCDGYSVSSCPPIYLAIRGESSNNRCSGYRCRFPNDIQYSISLENVGCASSCTAIVVQRILVLLSLCILVAMK